MARRRFLKGTLAGMAGWGGLAAFTRPAAARELESQRKRLIVFNLHGGLSQLESWDPKPGTDTGGPFRAIATSVPGLHFSELLPESAKIAHLLGVVRGVDTSEDDHGKGAFMMLTGRRQTPAAEYPVVGAVAAKALAAADSPLPGHIQIYPGGAGRSADSAYLGPKYASLVLGNGQPPGNLVRPGGMTDESVRQQDEFRRLANRKFLERRRTAYTDAYAYSSEKAIELMERRELFDVTKESAKDQQRYGGSDFARHCLLARRLVERGVTAVQVNHSNYDTHCENFDFHLEQVVEFDRPFATLIADLNERGLLDHTLVLVVSEFGRTPGINLYHGRDHWSRAWSVVAAGAGIKRGVVHGATNPRGTEVVSGKVDHAALFHTWLTALELESSDHFDIDGRRMPLADPAAHPVTELLA
jgi:hypothetical protein